MKLIAFFVFVVFFFSFLVANSNVLGCVFDSGCSSSEDCVWTWWGRKCVDVCSRSEWNNCHQYYNAECVGRDHKAQCVCRDGYTADSSGRCVETIKPVAKETLTDSITVYEGQGPVMEFTTSNKSISLQNEEVHSWLNALKACSKQGKELLTIENKDEHDAMTKQLKTKAGLADRTFWIGARKDTAEGTFMWEAFPGDKRHVKFTGWGKGEPQMRRNTTCAGFRHNYWVSKNCGEKHQVFCQKRNTAETETCETHTECGQSRYCKNFRCLDAPPKPQVCRNACGPNTICDMTPDFEASCSCEEGYVGDPFDKSHGCYHECEDDSKCRGGHRCENNTCVANPTEPEVCKGACGPNAICKMAADFKPICTCTMDEFIGNPYDKGTGCYYECLNDDGCKADAACENHRCVAMPPPEPLACPNACGQNSECKMIEKPYFEPLCSCEKGFAGNPYNRNTGCVQILAPDVVNAEICWSEDFEERSPACQKFFRKKPSKQFYIHQEEASWFDALRNCKNDDKMLAIIENSADREKLENLIIEQNLMQSKLWLAGSDLKHKNRFQWLAGTTFNTIGYTNWGAQEPNKKIESSTCLTVGNRFSWTNENCKQTHYFVCQSV